jgi:hypothetical protein
MGTLMTAYGTELQRMGVDPRTKGDPASNYNLFRGFLQEALMEHLQDTKKPATPDDILGPIMQKLRAQTTSESMFKRFFGSTDYSYQQWHRPLPEEVPQEFIDKARREVESRGYTATDDQIRKQYTRSRFQELTGTTEKPAAKGGKLEGAKGGGPPEPGPE